MLCLSEIIILILVRHTDREINRCKEPAFTCARTNHTMQRGQLRQKKKRKGKSRAFTKIRREYVPRHKTMIT